jgi:aminoglycoside phosphotransferase (APT) family kinase protein
VRIPRREIADQLVLNEQRWLPVLADRLPIPTPVPLRLGKPTPIYPWHWSVLPWFEGQGADLAAPGHSEVAVVANFLLKLHQPAPHDAPDNPVRGVPIARRAEATQTRIARVQNRTHLIGPAIERIWERGLAAPTSNDARWLHGDLHAQNVLVANGRITAVIDWGDITSGDVATDLAAVWGLFEQRAHRERLLELYAPDQATLDRARAWAVSFGAILVDSGLVNSPRHAAQGRDLLSRLAADA